MLPDGKAWLMVLQRASAQPIWHQHFLPGCLHRRCPVSELHFRLVALHDMPTCSALNVGHKIGGCMQVRGRTGPNESRIAAERGRGQQPGIAPGPSCWTPRDCLLPPHLVPGGLQELLGCLSMGGRLASVPTGGTKWLQHTRADLSVESSAFASTVCIILHEPVFASSNFIALHEPVLLQHLSPHMFNYSQSGLASPCVVGRSMSAAWQRRHLCCLPSDSA